METLQNVSEMCSNLVGKYHPSFNWRIGAGIAASSVFSLGVFAVFRLRRRLIPCSWYFPPEGVDLRRKLIIVTGSNTGIGKEVARQLAVWNGDVILACRSEERGETAATEIRRQLTDGSVTYCHLDLSSIRAIEEFVNEIAKRDRKVDILINNAAVYGCPYLLTKDGFETQFQVNYLGHFLLTNLLLKRQMFSECSKIVCVSSGLYKKGTIDFNNLNGETQYLETRAYSNSKLAVIHFVRELANRLPHGVTVNCVHPGIVLTELARYRATTFVRKTLLAVVGWLILRTPQQGAVPVLGVATDPCLYDVSGQYFGNTNIPEDLLPHAVDDDVAQKLWLMSEEMVKHTF